MKQLFSKISLLLSFTVFSLIGKSFAFSKPDPLLNNTKTAFEENIVKIPEPATMVLFGIALIGLGAIGCKRLFKKRKG